MSSLNISLVAFATIFGGSMLGVLLRSILPDHHLNPESKEVVKMGMELVLQRPAARRDLAARAIAQESLSISLRLQGEKLGITPLRRQ